MKIIYPLIFLLLIGCTNSGGSGSHTLTVVGNGNTAQLAWVAPITNEDGTVLTNLAGFWIYYGNIGSRSYTTSVRVDNPSITEYTIDNLEYGQTYYFTITAYNSLGFESTYSNEVSLTIP